MSSDVTLIADGGEMTVSRRMATHIWGAWDVTLPDNAEQVGTDARVRRGFSAKVDMEHTGLFDRAFIRADAKIDIPAGTSNLEEQIETAAKKVQGQTFFERDITQSGLGHYLPGSDFVVGDVVKVRIWGRLLELLVTSIEMTTGAGNHTGWRVHVGGQMIDDLKALKTKSSEVEAKIAEERRQRFGSTEAAKAAATRAESLAGEAKTAATEAKETADSVSGVATDAKAAADEAKEKAEAVNDLATDAKSMADNALRTVNNAMGEISKAQEYSDQAKTASAESLQYSERSKEYSEAALVSAQAARAESEKSIAASTTAATESQKSIEASNRAGGYSTQALEASRLAGVSESNALEYRAAAERFKDLAEQERMGAEFYRQGAESARALAETARAGAESERALAETARARAEDARSQAEASRSAAETSRSRAETERAKAEAARIKAESARAEADTARSSTVAKASEVSYRAQEIAQKSLEMAELVNRQQEQFELFQDQRDDAQDALISVINDAHKDLSQKRSGSLVGQMLSNYNPFQDDFFKIERGSSNTRTKITAKGSWVGNATISITDVKTPRVHLLHTTIPKSDGSRVFNDEGGTFSSPNTLVRIDYNASPYKHYVNNFDYRGTTSLPANKWTEVAGLIYSFSAHKCMISLRVIWSKAAWEPDYGVRLFNKKTNTVLKSRIDTGIGPLTPLGNGRVSQTIMVTGVDVNADTTISGQIYCSSSIIDQRHVESAHMDTSFLVNTT